MDKLGVFREGEYGGGGHHVRRLTPADLDSVAQVHVRAFPDSVLTCYGKAVVVRYYHYHLTGPHDCHALGVFTGSACLGFAFGGVFRDSMGGFVRENMTMLLRHVAARPWLLLQPKVFDRGRSLFRLFYRKRKVRRKRRTKPHQDRPYGILSIATDPSRQGKGVGRELMLAHERIACDEGFARMSLTVAHDNEKAIRFYEHLGWRFYRFGPDGSHKMERLLDPRLAASSVEVEQVTPHLIPRST